MVVSDDSAPFDPSAYLSQDLSCAIYHDCPCIFMGSNSWATAAELDPETQASRISSMAVRIGAIRKANPKAIMVVAVVPEKDYIIDRMFTLNRRGDGLTESMALFRKKLAEFDIQMVFDEYIEGLAHHQAIEDYAYPDSHLPTANYIQILAGQLAHADVPWKEVRSRLSVQQQPEYCDLVDKLRLGINNPIEFSLPQIAGAELSLIDGTDSFSEPLGDTTQVFSNPDLIDERDLLLLGDSHSSIYTRKKLTYLNAHVFSNTTFQWNPCGFRNEVRSVPQPVIFMEISQRFLFTRN